VVEALEGPIREDVARLRALGAVLPEESYDRLAAPVSGHVETLSPDVGAILAAMLLTGRRDALAARLAALPMLRRERQGAPLRRKIEAIEAALAALAGAGAASADAA
jgi:hypothetical protein